MPFEIRDVHQRMCESVRVLLAAAEEVHWPIERGCECCARETIAVPSCRPPPDGREPLLLQHTMRRALAARGGLCAEASKEKCIEGVIRVAELTETVVRMRVILRECGPEAEPQAHTPAPHSREWAQA